MADKLQKKAGGTGRDNDMLPDQLVSSSVEPENVGELSTRKRKASDISFESGEATDGSQSHNDSDSTPTKHAESVFGGKSSSISGGSSPEAEHSSSESEHGSTRSGSTDSLVSSACGTDRDPAMPKLQTWESISSSSSYTRIPNKTSKWTSEVLKTLGISIVRDKLYPPLRIVHGGQGENPEMKPFVEWLKDVIVKRKYVTTYNVLESKVQKIMEHLKFYKPLSRIDVENIEQIKDHEANIFGVNLNTDDVDVTSMLPFLQPVDQLEKCWNHIATM